ncbi:formin-like protein 16 [Biomphalaria glabrata]|nr:formin-like protein 16 [Biomphalaria glabrata]
MGGYGAVGEYKPEANYGVTTDYNSVGYNQQQYAGGYQWQNTGNMGQAAAPTGQAVETTGYNYGYGNYSGGYEDYSAGYDYGYGNNNQEQWSDPNAVSYPQTYQNYPVGTNYVEPPKNAAMPTYTADSSVSFNGRGRGATAGRGATVGRGASVGRGAAIGRGATVSGGGFAFGMGESFGGDTSTSSFGRGVSGGERGRGAAGFRGSMSSSCDANSFRGKGSGGRGGGAARGGSSGGSARGGAGRGGGAVAKGFGVSAGRGRGGPTKNDSVASRLLSQMQPLSPFASMATYIERWKTFALNFTDCGNAVSNIECSLKASKINYLQINFDCKFLAKCSTYSIFTGVLQLNKLSTNHQVVETIYLARGIGLSKKSAKMDCYEKAYKLLTQSSISDITSQTDYGEEVLIQEVRNIYKDNPTCFMEMLKKSNALADIDISKSTPVAKPSVSKGAKTPAGKGNNRKRPTNTTSASSDAKKPRISDRLQDVLDNKHLSLAPTKKIGVLMSPNDSLLNKLTKLKELLKEEGITKLHIVPKIDQIAHKTAIHIQNVYRFEDVPILGFENRMPVYCEIYFDDVFMALGEPDMKRNIAMLNAYTNLASLLYIKPIEEFVACPKVWNSYMCREPDVCNVVTKWQGEDNNSLLTSNLANMKQMMQSMPDVTIPIEKMVLTEHESDKDIQNVFKALELSATRNLMLLECEIVRNPDMKFTCLLSLQGRLLASRTHTTKNGSKRVCSEAVMNEMKKKHDYIYVTTEFIGHTITKQELIQKAMKMKAAGEPPAKIFYKKQENKVEDNSLEARVKLEEDKTRNEQMENLPENTNIKPLLPWMAAVMYDIIDDYYKRITLEDLMVNVSEMTKSQRDMVTACASKMGLRVITKLKTQHDSSLLRRTVTAQDMSKMLQLHGGTSGRYKLLKCVNPCPPDELNRFRQECLTQHKLLVDARNNDDPDAEVLETTQPVAATPPFIAVPKNKIQTPSGSIPTKPPSLLSLNSTPAKPAIRPLMPASHRPSNPANVRPSKPPNVRPSHPPKVRPSNHASGGPYAVRPPIPASVRPPTVRPLMGSLIPPPPRSLRPTRPPRPLMEPRIPPYGGQRMLRPPRYSQF